MNLPENKYRKDKLESVFRKLLDETTEFRDYYYKKIYEYEDDPIERNSNAYNDIGELARFIVKKKKKNKTIEFEQIFENVENILENCDNDVKNLIVVGLFEGIQNIGGNEIDYYFSFNKWLKTESQNEWNTLIDFWEGKEWRIPKVEREKREIGINKILIRKR